MANPDLNKAGLSRLIEEARDHGPRLVDAFGNGGLVLSIFVVPDGNLSQEIVSFFFHTHPPQGDALE
jgi:hypothetical protein